jgi:hypothetical protein
MCSPANDGSHQATDCHCYNRQHAMIELAKANNQFAHDIKEALRCPGSDSPAVF